MAPEPTATTGDFKLGDWWVRPQRHELEGPETAQSVEARSMGVLVCLARYAPEVVTKERLFEEVWSDAPFVGEDVISHAVWELRKALGDSAREPRYIQTVPRKGYRLVAEVLRPQGSALPLEGARIDHYELGGEIGRGTMGVVFEAVDRRLERTVAIKFLAEPLTRDPEACRRFEREARLAASLDHPNLGTVHEIGETSAGHRYLVSPLYRGGSLRDRLGQGPLDLARALELLRQLVAGLGAAHARDIVHRDIKPANLLLDEHGTLKICDFGIAKLLGATDLTRTGSSLGTPAYQSPEQSRGGRVDHRTDLWSAGVVFHELVTGRRPGEEGGRSVPADVQAFLGRALAEDPSERFQSADDMASALGVLEGAPGLGAPGLGAPGLGAPGLGAPGLSSRVTARRPLAAALVVGLALLLVGMASWRGLVSTGWKDSFFGRETPQPAPDPAEEARRRDGLDALRAGREGWLRGNSEAGYEQVEKQLERAVELPKSAEARALLAAFLVERYLLGGAPSYRKRAEGLIEQALVLAPDSSTARAARAWLLLDDGEVEKAEGLARTAIALEPTCSREASCDLAYIVRADALLIQGKREDALDLLQQGVGQGGGHVRCRLKLAQLHAKEGEKLKAQIYFEEVLDLEPDQVTALNELGNLYLALGRNQEAEEVLRRLYQATGDLDVLINLGNALYELGLWDPATEAYQDAHAAFLQLGQLVPTPLVALGDIALENHDPATAETWYEKALEIFEALESPGPRRLAQQAACLAKLRRFEEADEVISALFDQGRDQDFPDLFAYAARVEALRGDRDALAAWVRKGLARGLARTRFLNDVAFLELRQDADYQKLLGFSP